MAPVVPFRDSADAPLGWRWWLIEVDHHGLVLRPPVTGQRWEGRSAAASCSNGHATPRRSCSCGISAYSDFDTAAERQPLSSYTRGALGLVRATGRVVLEPDGWRAASIEIVLLFAVGGDDTVATELT